MFSAVVNAFDQPPRYQEFDRPTPSGPHDVLVDVLGAGLHPRVRSQADGSHYTSTDELPLVPGIDGVGRLPDGQLVYFILPDTVMGSMAEQTVIDRRRSIALPAGADPLRIAAAMNPAMSSWVALRRRIEFQAGQRVLILGATGSAGSWPSRSPGSSVPARSSRPAETSCCAAPCRASARTSWSAWTAIRMTCSRASDGPGGTSTSSSTTSGAHPRQRP